MGIGLAVAAAGAAASVAGSVISANAAKSAASQQTAAANTASERAQDQFNTTRADLAPFRAGGVNALNLLNGIYGQPTAPNPLAAPTSGGGLPPGWTIIPSAASGGTLDASGNFSGPSSAGGFSLVDQAGNIVNSGASPEALLSGFMTAPSAPSAAPVAPSSGNVLTDNGLSGLTFQPTQAQLEATPGYQFTRAQGLRGVENSASATGRGISGPALKGAANFATGLADQTLKTQQGIFQSNLGNVINPLEFLTNLGQNAATQTGQLGVQATQNSNALLVGGANAAAAGTVGSSNALAGGLSSLGGSPLNYLLYNKLLGTGGSDFYAAQNASRALGPAPAPDFSGSYNFGGYSPQ